MGGANAWIRAESKGRDFLERGQRGATDAPISVGGRVFQGGNRFPGPYSNAPQGVRGIAPNKCVGVPESVDQSGYGVLRVMAEEAQRGC